MNIMGECTVGEETLYVIASEDDQCLDSNRASPLDVVIVLAKQYAKQGRRTNVYKLVQTHTFAPKICNDCGSLTANEKYVGGENPL